MSDDDSTVSPASTSRKQFAKDVTKQDCVLLVLGGPGAGKTTFVHELTGIPMRVRPPKERLAPDTTEIDYRWIKPTTGTKGNRLIVIDTPAIDGPENYQIFCDLMVWIRAAVKKRVAFMGFIYVHDILSSNVTFDFLQLRDLFAPCVDAGIPHKLVLATTKWNRLSLEDGERYEQVLEQEHWKELLEGGTKVVRLTPMGVFEKETVMDILPEPKGPEAQGRLTQLIRLVEVKLHRFIDWLRP